MTDHDLTLSLSLSPYAMRVCTFFFFNDTATTEIYTLSLHDALPIYKPRVAMDFKVAVNLEIDRHVFAIGGKFDARHRADRHAGHHDAGTRFDAGNIAGLDRKSTRLNSSHT